MQRDDQGDLEETVSRLQAETRLTPRPTRIDGADFCNRSLDGSWQFRPNPSDDFPSPEIDDASWETISVPGEWGRDRDDVHDGVAGYRRRIHIPEHWDERRVKLRFDAVYSHATVWVDGEAVGAHEGGYTPFECDITEQVTPGSESVLAVVVREDSIASRMAVQHPAGGITRSVSLFAVPNTFLSWFHVETELESAADADRGTIRCLLEVTNERPELIENAFVLATVFDPDGNRVAVSRHSVDSLAAGTSQRTDLEISIDDPKTWAPEHPNQYELICELHDGQSFERVSRLIGVRQLEVDGNQLLLNGTPITLRGVNRHEVHPRFGRSVPPRLTRSDVERFKEANINYIRTSHYPPSEALVEACDEVGILVEEEAPFHHLWNDDLEYATDPEYEEIILRQTLEMVERDRSHPSVGLWSLGNESDWGRNFAAAARLLEVVDPTRPRTFNQDKYSTEDAELCQIGNHHYPETRPMESGLGRVASFEDHDRPVLFGEYVHTYCYNEHELSADPGLRENWAKVLETIWERIYETDACVGGAIWAGIDDSVYEREWGLLDEWRRPKPEYWHVKKVYSPVHVVSSERGVQNGQPVLNIELENRFDVTNLRTCRFEWDVGDESGSTRIDVAPGSVETLTLPLVDGSEPVSLRAVHSDGRVLDHFEFSSPADDIVATDSTAESNELVLEESVDQITVRCGNQTWTVDRTGRLKGGQSGNVDTVIGGPHLVVTPRERFDGTYSAADQEPPKETLTNWRCDGLDTVETDDGIQVTIRGEYNEASGEFRLRFSNDSRLEIESRFTAHERRDIREIGVALDIDTECDGLSWIRDGHWSVYPDDHIGRPVGTARAFDGTMRSAEPGRDGPPWPWEKELTSRGTHDFRGSKYRFRTAVLTTTSGSGIRFYSGDQTIQHFRAIACPENIRTFVIDHSLVGSGPNFLDRPYGLEERKTIEPGDSLNGTYTVQLLDESPQK